MKPNLILFHWRKKVRVFVQILQEAKSVQTPHEQSTLCSRLSSSLVMPHFLIRLLVPPLQTTKKIIENTKTYLLNWNWNQNGH